MTTLQPLLSISSQSYPFHTRTSYLSPKSHQPISIFSQICSKSGAFHKNRSNLKTWGYTHTGLKTNKNFFQICSKCDAFHKNGSNLKTLGYRNTDGWVLWGEKRLKNNSRRRVVIVKSNFNFNFNGGGGDKEDGVSAKVLGNLALAVGLAYLSLSGQLGWVLDTIVSLWLLSIVLPIVGFVAFLWWAKRDIVQSACPNCGNEFQVFKSSLNDEVQLCPFCTQPFSVEGNEFVKEPINFSNRSSPLGQTFDDFSPWSKKGKDVSASTTIVDVEAEVKDAE